MDEKLIPSGELRRAISLADFDLDYSATHEKLRDLTKLAAKIAGTEISLINLIDLYTQWTVAHYGDSIEQLSKEDSICKFTIVSPDDHFEVKDLSADERFSEKEFVKSGPMIRYYLGVPLETNDGYRLGTLCVMDPKEKQLDKGKIELLRIIADEIVQRLGDIKDMQELENRMKAGREIQKKVAHDIRGPLSGIVNLAHIIAEQGNENKMDEVLEVVNMIHTSGNSLLEFAEEILTPEQAQSEEDPSQAQTFNLLVFKDKLLKLYSPQAIHKQVRFTVEIHPDAAVATAFPKNKLLQITGNLVSNAIKFTPDGGIIAVNLHLVEGSSFNKLVITVADTGVGLAQDQINYILKGTSSSTDGTSGEQGYGYGLSLVKHLVDSMNGTIEIRSGIGEGTSFELILPLSKL